MKNQKQRMKSTINDEILGRLRDFAETLESGASITEKYTCRRVVLNLNPTAHNPGLVKKTRGLLGASQAMFAKFLGVKVKTVQAWEQGTVTPSAMACRFMDEIRNSPGYWLERFKGALVSKSA